MYSIQIFEDLHVPFNWATALVGLKLNCFPLDEVDGYAVKCLSENSHMDNKFLLELAWGNKKYEEIIALIENLIIDLNCNSEFLLEERKWRYCILKTIREVTEDENVLLVKVAEVYSDFNYPEVMEEMIYYNEPKDGYNPLLHTKDENIDRLVNKIDTFLDIEKNKFLYK